MTNDEKRLDGRRNNGGYLPAHPRMVSLPAAHKRAAVRKLREIYGVMLSTGAGSNTIAPAVARALKIDLPSNFADAARMISAFAQKDYTPPPPDTTVDRAALLRDRFPFKPYVHDAAMERALERCREFRAIGAHAQAKP